MKNKLAWCSTLFVLALFLGISGLVKAQDTAADAFIKYTNPHDICNYYREQGIKVVRESDTECLTSLGEGQHTVYTQYYYSGNNWCYKLTQQGQTQYSNCIPIPHSANSTANAVDEFFSNFHIDSQNEPYVIAGGAVLVLVVVVSVVSAAHRARLMVGKKWRQPPPKNSMPNRQQVRAKA